MIRISRSRQGKGAFDKRKEPPVKKYVAPAQQSSSYGTRKKKKAAALSLAECCTGKKIFNYTRRLHRSGEDRVDLFKGIITAQHWSTRNATCGRVHIGHSLITLITQGTSICSLRANTMYGGSSQSPLTPCDASAQVRNAGTPPLFSSLEMSFPPRAEGLLKGGGKIGSILAGMLL